MNNKNYKICIVGNTGVGKTCLIKKLVTSKFDYDFNTSTPTIGVAFSMLQINNYIFHIWDTAGQERYKCIAPIYYKNADIVIIVFDLTNIESLRSIQRWYIEIIDKNDTAKIIIIGNKTDLSTINKTEINYIINKFIDITYLELNVIDNSILLLKNEISKIAQYLDNKHKNNVYIEINTDESNNKFIKLLNWCKLI
jgi:small GTP-binding protein